MQKKSKKVWWFKKLLLPLHRNQGFGKTPELL